MINRSSKDRRAILVGTGNYAPSLLARLLSQHAELTPTWRVHEKSTPPSTKVLKASASGRVLRIAPPANTMLHEEEAQWRWFFAEAALHGWAIIWVRRSNLLDLIAAYHDGGTLEQTELWGELIAAEKTQERMAHILADAEPLTIDSSAFDTAIGQMATLVSVQRHIGVKVRRMSVDLKGQPPRRFSDAIANAASLIPALQSTEYSRYLSRKG